MPNDVNMSWIIFRRYILMNQVSTLPEAFGMNDAVTYGNAVMSYSEK